MSKLANIDESVRRLRAIAQEYELAADQVFRDTQAFIMDGPCLVLESGFRQVQEAAWSMELSNRYAGNEMQRALDVVTSHLAVFHAIPADPPETADDIITDEVQH